MTTLPTQAEFPANPGRPLVIPTDEVEPIQPAESAGGSLEVLQAIVGGYIDLVKIGSHEGYSIDLVINDEGKVHGLPKNSRATVLAAETGAIRLGDFIAGPAAVVLSDPSTGESYGVTREAAQSVRQRARL